MRGESRKLLALRAQQFAQLLIDFHCILRGLIDQFNPAAGVLGRPGLREEVSSLYDGFKSVAEIVRQCTEFSCQFGRDFIGGIRHGLGARGALQISKRSRADDPALV